MSGLTRVAPDREWFIVEENLRFPVDAAVPANLVPIVVASDLRRSIDILEKHRGWKYLDSVPTHRKYAKPCCDQIEKGRAGSPLRIRFQPSPLQADTDDAHNFGGTYSPNGVRLYVDGKIDWVAIMHFWQPGIVVTPAEDRENMFLGGLTPAEMPPEYLAKTNRFDWYFEQTGIPKPQPKQKVAADGTVAVWHNVGRDREQE